MIEARRLSPPRAAAASAAALVLVLVGVAVATADPRRAGGPAASAPVPTVVPQIVAVHPHDRLAWTQGLLWHDGLLYESTGESDHPAGPGPMRSTLREVEPTTGQVLRQVELADGYFAEGLARVDGRLIQLTWQRGLAFVYERETLRRVDNHTYGGEGWGLCRDGDRLVMSDGSDTLTLRDAATFEVRARVPVTLDGMPLSEVPSLDGGRPNELECVGGRVLANVWLTDRIVVIAPDSGRVEAVVDISGLLTPEERADPTIDIANGIAYVPSRDTFLLTGKWWPHVFEVRLPLPSSPALYLPWLAHEAWMPSADGS